jgi:hypothetical protein
LSWLFPSQFISASCFLKILSLLASFAWLADTVSINLINGRFAMNIKMAAWIVALLLMAGCRTEIGSDEWCAKVAAKPKASWSEGDAADYARHCVNESS